MDAIRIHQLSKVYAGGTQALHHVDLEIPVGDFFALLGANGAGKTTLIGILTGLVRKTEGEVCVFQHNIDTHFAEAKRMIGVVPQEFNFSIFEKVQDILVTQAGYFGIDRRQAGRESEILLKRLGLWEKRAQPARALSGGMKRRLMIARALVHRPKLLILDEPTAGVDVELRHGMWDYLRDLNQQQGVTVLLTTHYLEEVEQMCRRAAIIKKGEIIRQATVKELMQIMDEETYVVSVDAIQYLDVLAPLPVRVVDSGTFEVDVNRRVAMNTFLQTLASAGMTVTDIRPKGHRLERLFLNLLKHDE